MCHVVDSGIRIAKEKEFIEQFIRIYLETDPHYGQEAVSQELVDKWVRGTYKSMTVSRGSYQLVQ